MKTLQTLKYFRRLSAVAGGFALFTGALQAAPFIYSSGDLLLAVRQTGGSYDYVVNLGKATNYSAVPPGTTLAITNLSASQLGFAFPSVNDLAWSVAGAIRTAGNPNFPQQTLWVAAPRIDTAAQSPAWLRKGSFSQGTTGGQIDAIGNNTSAYSSSQSSNANNTVVGVVIPTSSPDYALAPVIGDGGNYVGTFQGNAENTTPSDFDGDLANVSRSDLYELLPGTVGAGTYNTPGRHLGFFELKPDGTLTFKTTATLPPAPTITGITRVGNVTTVSFTTVTNATYSLVAVNGAGLTTPVSGWSVGASTGGTGNVLSLSDTNATDVRFYSVKVQSP